MLNAPRRIAALLSAPAAFPAWGLAAAAISLGLGWGFMVDDALITTRVAHQLASSGHYRFNPIGAHVDCVTPLGFAWLAVPFAAGGPLQAFNVLRLLGALCHLLSGAVLGALMQQSASNTEARWRTGLALTALAPLAVSLPWGAWGASGMETPFVTLLCTLALLPLRSFPLWVAFATAWRPELIPWGVTLTLLRADSASLRVKGVLLCLLGPLLVALTRVWVFGHPAPLAIFAKPSDIDHGLSYVVGALRLLGVPLLWVAWRAWRHQPRPVYAAALAAAVHAAALCAAGGDWMPYFRLWVPLLPGLAWVGYHVLLRGSPWPNMARGAFALGMSALLCVTSAPLARHVLSARLALIAQARPLLLNTWNIGTLDVGWVGSATSSTITDFAGVTDPSIAYLPGGHTSKRLPNDLLLRLEVDCLVLLTAPGFEPKQLEASHWTQIQFARTVENRAARLDGAREFVPVAALPLGGTQQYYLVLKRASERMARVRSHVNGIRRRTAHDSG